MKLTSPDQMRLSNLHRVLHEIVYNDGICRKEIAERTALSSQTVTNLVKEMIDRGIVAENAPQGIPQRGRNPIGLRFCAAHFRMLTAVASSEGIEVVLHTMDGAVLARRRAPLGTGVENLNALRTFSLAFAREEKAAGGSLMAEVISVEGVVNESTCEVIRATVLEWVNLNLGGALAEMHIPVLVQNDVNIAAHYICLTRRDTESCMLVKLDNGVGSAFILNGQVLRSMNNVAGELGHVTVHAARETRRCECGKINCLTQYISIPSLERRRHSSIEAFYDACHAADPQALALADSIVDDLTPPLANLVGLLDLDAVFFIGRTTRQLSDRLFPQIETAVRARLSSWSNPRQICQIPEKAFWEISPLFLLDEYFTHHPDTPYLWDEGSSRMDVNK